jgi:hypothetical protein
MTSFIVKNGSPVPGRLVYDGTGFDTEPRPLGCVASVAIQEVELMLCEEDARVVFVTGYCPYQGWWPAVLVPPPYRSAILIAAFEEPLVMGTAVGLVSGKEIWPVYVDARSGWVRLGEGNSEKGLEGIEFAPGAVAELEGSRLTGLWLKPYRLPQQVPLLG